MDVLAPLAVNLLAVLQIGALVASALFGAVVFLSGICGATAATLQRAVHVFVAIGMFSVVVAWFIAGLDHPAAVVTVEQKVWVPLAILVIGGVAAVQAGRRASARDPAADRLVEDFNRRHQGQ